MWWYWHIWSSHLSYVVILWPNFEASHSLTEHVQCNHHLVTLPYLRLHLSYAVTTTLIKTTTHQLDTTHQVQWDVAPTCFYQGVPGSWQFFPKDCKTSHGSLKHRPSPFICLNHTAKIKHFVWKYWILLLKYFSDQIHNITYFSWNEKHDFWNPLALLSSHLSVRNYFLFSNYMKLFSFRKFSF